MNIVFMLVIYALAGLAVLIDSQHLGKQGMLLHYQSKHSAYQLILHHKD